MPSRPSDPINRLMWYTPPCLLNHFVPSCVAGGVLYAIQDVMLSGMRPSMEGFGRYAGVIYAYNAIQCPMEAIHGRKSILHNILGGGLLGYVGVSRGWVG
eukprot:CAMPEP_0184481672 /NCGR_PEP_ID=MMETSP0113_2-20130426/3231_1 /TAXON_ID=91329 /ORGANISM="Norrisiella sphaerica, Strain BC52" /LENGTH=99 /DNA_ID=CAMNT_0026860931 /DNA_START=82 /DNA_END=377 /DNA_ORIENTATION=-